MAGSNNIINIMVVGECGDGKSTLINGLRDRTRSAEALCGKRPQGVTKHITMYPCLPINGIPFNIVDTPGVGDAEVSPAALIIMIEQFLQEGKVPGGVRGLVVTTQVPDGRIKLGAQIVQLIVDKGFVAPAGVDKYANVILCGTKLDRADDADRMNFMHGQSSVKQLFFGKAVNHTGPCVMVSHNDYTPLLRAINRLPIAAITYEKPESHVMASALAEKMGTRSREAQIQIESMREQVEEGAAQMRRAMLERQAQERRFREERAQRELQNELLRLQMLRQEQQRREEEALHAIQMEVQQMVFRAEGRGPGAMAARMQLLLLAAMLD